MIYMVSGRFKAESAASFLQKLADGTIERQRPDGAEIVASMNRAVVTASGHVQWSELCYCPSPVQHERATVLDHRFDDLSTEPIDGHEHYDGRPFMDYLKELATSP